MAKKTLAQLKSGRDFTDVLDSVVVKNNRVIHQPDVAISADDTAVVSAANVLTGIVQCTVLTGTTIRSHITDTVTDTINYYLIIYVKHPLLTVTLDNFCRSRRRM